MVKRNYFITLLIFLCAVFSINGIKKSLIRNTDEHAKDELSKHISSKSTNTSNESVFEIVGIVHPSINETEINSPGFRNIQNSKKALSFKAILEYSYFSKKQFVYYCSKRINNIDIFDLYITFRKLII